MMAHAPKDFFRFQGDVIQADPFGLHRSGLQRVSSIVVATGNGQK
jgi:hypothetical protein